MKIHVLSDVHLELQKCRNQSSLGNIDCDVHVLAGDIGVGLAGIEWALHNFSKPVIYVFGNHEFYGQRPKMMRLSAKPWRLLLSRGCQSNLRIQHLRRYASK